MLNSAVYGVHPSLKLVARWLPKRTHPEAIPVCPETSVRVLSATDPVVGFPSVGPVRVRIVPGAAMLLVLGRSRPPQPPNPILMPSAPTGSWLDRLHRTTSRSREGHIGNQRRSRVRNRMHSKCRTGVGQCNQVHQQGDRYSSMGLVFRCRSPRV